MSPARVISNCITSYIIVTRMESVLPHPVLLELLHLQVTMATRTRHLTFYLVGLPHVTKQYPSHTLDCTSFQLIAPPIIPTHATNYEGWKN